MNDSSESPKSPRLRSVSKSKPPYKLNKFPSGFPIKLGRELAYSIAIKGKGVLAGEEWEEVFANCIDAEWRPSNVGLDDIVLGNTAWGAKSVKAKRPSNQKRIRLISGRNSLVYSYGETIDVNADPNSLGPLVLGIWNERVSAIRKLYKNLRTVVLIKSDDLREVVVFEFETVRFDPSLYDWKWNKRKNLEGFKLSDGIHCFTWQPHGSQFTIIEEVPSETLIIKLEKIPSLNKESVLKSIGFDNSWVTVERTPNP